MTAFRLLVTGAREVPDGLDELIRIKLDEVRSTVADGMPLIVVHGQCPYGGADLIAHLWARATAGVTAEPHPADWDRFGRGAGPRRNMEMAALGADLCLAFPARDSRGTWDCLRRAADAGIPGRVYPLVAS